MLHPQEIETIAKRLRVCHDALTVTMEKGTEYCERLLMLASGMSGFIPEFEDASLVRDLARTQNEDGKNLFRMVCDSDKLTKSYAP